MFLVVGAVIMSTRCHAQFLESQPIVKNEIKIDRQVYGSLKTARAMKTDDGKIYISWTIQGDCNEGSFVIYKSRDFFNPTLIGSLYYFGYDKKEHISEIPFYFSTVDSSGDNFYNMYHIVKKNKNESFYPSDINLISRSAVDFRVENINSSNKYYLRTPNQSEYYCLEF